MKFCTDIHDPQRMTLTDYGDRLTFPGAISRLTVLVFSDISWRHQYVKLFTYLMKYLNI